MQFLAVSVSRDRCEIESLTHEKPNGFKPTLLNATAGARTTMSASQGQVTRRRAEKAVRAPLRFGWRFELVVFVAKTRAAEWPLLWCFDQTRFHRITFDVVDHFP